MGKYSSYDYVTVKLRETVRKKDNIVSVSVVAVKVLVGLKTCIYNLKLKMK